MKDSAEKLDVNGLFSHVLDDEGVIIEDGRLRLTRREAFDATLAGMQGVKQLSCSYTYPLALESTNESKDVVGSRMESSLAEAASRHRSLVIPWMRLVRTRRTRPRRRTCLPPL